MFDRHTPLNRLYEDTDTITPPGMVVGGFELFVARKARDLYEQRQGVATDSPDRERVRFIGAAGRVTVSQALIGKINEALLREIETAAARVAARYAQAVDRDMIERVTSPLVFMPQDAGDAHERSFTVLLFVLPRDADAFDAWLKTLPERAPPPPDFARDPVEIAKPIDIDGRLITGAFGVVFFIAAEKWSLGHPKTGDAIAVDGKPWRVRRVSIADLQERPLYALCVDPILHTAEPYDPSKPSSAEQLRRARATVHAAYLPEYVTERPGAAGLIEFVQTFTETVIAWFDPSRGELTIGRPGNEYSRIALTEPDPPEPPYRANDSGPSPLTSAAVETQATLGAIAETLKDERLRAIVGAGGEAAIAVIDEIIAQAGKRGAVRPPAPELSRGFVEGTVGGAESIEIQEGAVRVKKGDAVADFTPCVCATFGKQPHHHLSPHQVIPWDEFMATIRRYSLSYAPPAGPPAEGDGR